PTSAGRTAACSSQGERNRTYSGAVDWRKIVLAEVVRRLARTNRTSVAAYAAPTRKTRQVHPRRAAGMSNQSTTAATPERNPAICQPVNAAALIAAPPVENRIAASARRSRAEVAEDTRGILRERPRPQERPASAWRPTLAERTSGHAEPRPGCRRPSGRRGTDPRHRHPRPHAERSQPDHRRRDLR